jgi:hypothetical protein
MKTHLLILKIFPKAAAEFMFKFNFFVIGKFCLVSIHNWTQEKNCLNVLVIDGLPELLSCSQAAFGTIFRLLTAV